MEVEKDKSREETSSESKKNKTKDHASPPTKYGAKRKKGRPKEENFNQETGLPFHPTYSPIVMTKPVGNDRAIWSYKPVGLQLTHGQSHTATALQLVSSA